MTWRVHAGEPGPDFNLPHVENFGWSVNSENDFMGELVAENSSQMQIEWWPLEKVVPYDANPRIRTEQQIEDLARSIREFGWQSQINVDADGVIITGHGRRLAALKLRGSGDLSKLHPDGLVPVKVERNLPPEKIRAFRIMDNKVAEGSKWDEDLLKLEMSQLLELLPDSIDLTGFSMENVGSLLGFKMDGDGEAPAEFKRADPDAPTTHTCPSCGYQWNKG